MKKLLISFLMTFALAFTTVQADSRAESPEAGVGMAMTKEMMRGLVFQSIQTWPLAEDVTIEDAIDSMKLRANTLNFKLVADLPLSEQIKAMGEEARYMQILAFCDALIAKRMVEHNKIFAGFLPCRISIIEDENGQGWVVTQNMDMMLNAVDLPPELEKLAVQVRDSIYSIVDAGVNGDL